MEPATGSSGRAPITLDEATAALAKAGDLDQVGEVLLGFLGRTYRRAALFHVTRDRVAGWRIHGTGIDRDAFAKFSVGFDQPSLFLNLREGSGVYLGPLPPMPAHRELARSWGGDLPRDCVMLPVRMKDRVVAMIYADGAKKVDLVLLQRLPHAFDIGEFACEKFCPRIDSTAMTFVQAVVNNDIVTVVQQFFRNDAPDVACATRDENPHLLNESFLNQPFVHDYFLVTLGAIDFVV